MPTSLFRYCCTSVFTILILLALPALAHAEDKLSPLAQFLENGNAKGNPRNAAVGARRFGYEYVNRSTGVEPWMTGWCKISSQGQTPYRFDPQATANANFLFWFELTTEMQILHRSEIPGPDGLYPTPAQFFQGLAKKTMHPASVGDKALASASLPAEVVAIRGPMVLRVVVYPRFSTSQVRRSPDDRYVDRLAWNYTTDFTKDPVPENWTDGPNLRQQYAKLCTAANEEALTVARTLVAAWDPYQARRFAYGPSFLGLYTQDLRPYWLEAADLPKAFLPDSANSKPSPRGWLSARYTIKYPKTTQVPDHEDRFSVSLQQIEIQSADPADFQAIMKDAVAKASHVSSDGKNRRALRLTAADEAGQDYSDSETVTWFRVGNLVGKISSSGWATSPTHRPLAINLAQLLINKITGSSGGLADAASLTLSANTTALWADGKATATLRLEARDEQGQPVAGAFDLDVANTALGNCDLTKLVTDANGIAQATYTTAKLPGQNTLTVSGRTHSATLRINQGGLRLRTAQPAQIGLYADGKHAISLLAECLDPAGQTLPNIPITLQLDEPNLTQHGRLTPDSGPTDAAGQLRFDYTPENLSPIDGTRLASARITATASPGTPPIALADSLNLTLSAGQCLLLTAEKTGYTTVSQLPVPVQMHNGTLTGTLQGNGFISPNAPDDAAGGPVAFANLTLSTPDAKNSWTATTDSTGHFAIKFQTDPTNPKASEDSLPGPLVLSLDPELVRLQREAAADLRVLALRSYQVTDATKFWLDLPQALAQSKPGHVNPAARPDYLVSAACRLTWLAQAIKTLDARQTESVDWAMASLADPVEHICSLLAVNDKLAEVFQDKLLDQYEPAAWQNFKESLLGKLLAKIEEMRNNAKARADALGIKDDDDPPPPSGAWATTKDKAQTLAVWTHSTAHVSADTIVTALRKRVMAEIHDTLISHAQHRLQHIFNQATLTLVGGSAPVENYHAAWDRCRPILVAYEDEHQKVNIKNLNAELYRLDLELVNNTVVRGVFFCTELKKLFSSDFPLDLEELKKTQKRLLEGGKSITDLWTYVDSGFKSYQGYIWLVDHYRACDAAHHVAAELAGPNYLK